MVAKNFAQEASVCVCVCVCVRARVCVSPPLRILMITGHDMDPKLLIKQVLQLLYGSCSRYC